MMPTEEEIKADLARMDLADRIATGWADDEYRTFNPKMFADGRFPESEFAHVAHDTGSLGLHLSIEGVDVRYIYFPTFLYWNDHGQKFYGTVKRLTTNGFYETVDDLKERAKDKTLFLYMYLPEQNVVRFAIEDLSVKI